MAVGSESGAVAAGEEAGVCAGSVCARADSNNPTPRTSTAVTAGRGLRTFCSANGMLTMRRVRCISILSLLLLPSLAFADVIYLKSGRTISAESAREEGGKVQYQRGDNTYAIPASLVDHIDHSMA